jgi:hypothetical protein
VAHVKADRVSAGISAYETLLEKARSAPAIARTAVVLRSVNSRRVIALTELSGHESFRHLESAWDHHRLAAERHAVAESSSLALYRLMDSAGEGSFDPASEDAYAFEHVARGPELARALVAGSASIRGLRGALVFGSDDASSSAIVFRFEHSGEFDTFRASVAAQQALGPIGASGESVFAVRPVRTFG